MLTVNDGAIRDGTISDITALSGAVIDGAETVYIREIGTTALRDFREVEDVALNVDFI